MPGFRFGSGSANQCGSESLRIRIRKSMRIRNTQATLPVLRIRDVYPGSDFFPSRIPDPICLHLGSASKNLSILTQKKPKKWFLSSRKYDPGCSSRIPGCSSRIPDPNADFLPIPDPGVKKAPDPGSGSATLDFTERACAAA
jgi:hypothetical protein